MDMVISPGPISAVALWNDPDTGLSQHLGHCRKGRGSYLTVSFSTDRGGSNHHLCLNLHVPLDNGEQSMGIMINFRAQYLGPIVTRSHHRSIGYNQQPRKLSQTPEFIINQLDSFGSDGFTELVFMAHHPPELLLFQVDTPDDWRVADVEAQKRISRMRSLSRAERIRLFIPIYMAASLDEMVQTVNSVPVLEGRAFTSSPGYAAGVKEKWQDWGVITKDITVDTDSADEKADLVKHDKRRSSVDSEQQAGMGKGRNPKRVKPDPNPPSSVPANTHKALFRIGQVDSEPGVATSDNSTTETSTLVMSSSSSCSETPSLGGTTFTRIAPTTQLANKWAEWWEFMHGSLGANKADPMLADLMWRMMQAVRNNDAEEFAAGVANSALYSLNVDKKDNMVEKM